MELIIDIPDDEYKTLKTTGAWNSGLIECIKNGRTLDDVKAEILKRVDEHCARTLEIFDNIGKESEETEI